MNKRDLKKFRENYTDWPYGCFSEGLTLAVHFDEKDKVKSLGARWNPDPSGKGGQWWMPQSQLKRPCRYTEVDEWNDFIDEGTVLQWLNDQQMIAGAYGQIDPKGAEESVENVDNEKFVLSDGASEYAVMRFAEVGLVMFYHAGEKMWYNEADGKETWNHLVSSGFYRLSTENV